jgi:cobalt-precorrin-5B (C1)-methyltransferase
MATTRRKNLRRGYTTGACAAAAAAAAARSLLTQEAVRNIVITLHGGKSAAFTVFDCRFDAEKASCSVIKDAGDDPDITNGTEITASVEHAPVPGIYVAGGKGVGTVTRPGLEIPVGESAINPVPRRMITQSVTEAAAMHGHTGGLYVTISVPAGEELAKKTLNSRLGIVGGISIIGTTGIVIPYSKSAYAACISRSLDVAKACGCRQVVLATGRRSEKYAQDALKLPEESYILAGDFIGHALKRAARIGIPQAVAWGMIGKISKLANGHFYTNVSDSLVNMNMLVELARECCVPESVMVQLRRAVTANQVRKLLPEEYVRPYCRRLAGLASAKCRALVNGKVDVVCIITGPAGDMLGRSDEE